ncbi:hypothetical protein F9U39_15645 [Pectobacterium versatile]|uniref:Uncharacterized protein n=2 Tax=Pectobacterium TaxID=122277 RepID=A0AAW3SYV0_9GAMM|nr:MULTISPECIES: hypothetical protein [Pectobacterium]MBA5204778.1 hypothetical protein [Pectobacterium aroidearum]MBN3176362.1 hypothetical protein [Pectobacterium parmentieri]MBQ4790862.1 hypothetical protein [Pectobacterium versatile]QHQ23441.1 hypothetical protein GMX10_04635 [Pectobacterium parvum]QRN28966.1 hypothetical protein IG623_16760 [Pectobacterium parmentieri]
MEVKRESIDEVKHRLDSVTVIFNSYVADFDAQSVKLNKEKDERLVPIKQLMYTAQAELKKIRLEYEIACIESWGGMVDEGKVSPYIYSMIVWWHKNPDAMPDLDMIINNPPYKYFCRSALFAFIEDCGLVCHPKWDEKRCHLGRVSLRHSPSRYQMPFVLRGIPAFSQVMEKDDDGRVRFSIGNVCVRIYFEDELGFGVRRIAEYKELLINSEDKQCCLTINVTDESCADELIALNFPDIRSAYLHLIASRYRTKRYYHQLIKSKCNYSHTEMQERSE